jgi:hypothetical protein
MMSVVSKAALNESLNNTKPVAGNITPPIKNKRKKRISV